ncbi:metal-dependent hydrolase [Halovenus sp. HT40]|uniref:metal-dependent hydrolase n=1 Tax=Halovenus sp. HT40 TaxID=3126691 RepID=UPI00300F791F
MAELLSHVLFAFGLFTIVGWAVDWLDRKWVAVGAVGSLFPDLNRLDLLIDDYTVSQMLGVPFDWGGLSTLGGVVLLATAGAVLFASREERVRGFGLLFAGGISHLLVDGVKGWADGAGSTPLYPLSWWRPPTPGLYVSSDRWVLGIAVVFGLVVFLLDRRVISD